MPPVNLDFLKFNHIDYGSFIKNKNQTKNQNPKQKKLPPLPKMIIILKAYKIHCSLVQQYIGFRSKC